MKLYNRTANYSKMLLYHLLNLVKNHNTQYNVGRCINWHTTVISTNAVILIPEISLKEIIKYVDNDLIIRTIFKSLKTEIKV